MQNSELIPPIIYTMEDLAPLVPTRPTMCARALLVFLVACMCSLFCNAGRLSENSSQRVLIVLDLYCCGHGSEWEARTTPVDDRRPGIMIWLNPGLVPPPTPAGRVKSDWYTLNGAFASAFATPTAMGDHESLEAGGALMEEEWKWMWLR